MDNKEILSRARNNKDNVGEMEKARINRSCWIGNIVACVIAGIFAVIEGYLHNFTAVYAITMICYAWACVFYTCQYFIAKRPWQVLIGSVLYGLAFVISLVFYILQLKGAL